jgi:hypothetical protein
MAKNQMRFFPVGNGDTVLLETGGYTILIDLCYRDGCDSDDDDYYDFAPDLRDACRSRGGLHLTIFVLTHPDKDHLRGFTNLFHVGDPSSKDDEDLILVDEMWVSPYSLDPNYETDVSKPVLREIKRRWRLQGTDAGQKDGNRIRVLSSDGDENFGQVGENIGWTVLAPTQEEADIPAAEEGEDQPSSNDSSLVIRWSVTVERFENHALLGGDATVEVWDRVWDTNEEQPSVLAWHILLTPHHCSRGALARKNLDTGKYDYSDKANSALGQVEGDGFAVASSNEIKKNDDNPPSWEAKQKYIKILGKNTDSDPEERFLNPDTYKDGAPVPVIFEFTSNGPRLKVPAKKAARIEIISGGAATPARYGRHK